MNIDNIDINKLEAICQFGGWIKVGAETMPLVLPQGEPEHMDFDRQVVEAGVPVFLRPILPDDNLKAEMYLDGPRPEGFEELPDNVGHVIVRKVGPGLRVRRPAFVIMKDQLSMPDGQHRWRG